jgi:hypothetical protein
MSLSFSGDLILFTVVLMVLVTFPIKAGAHLAGARETGVVRCGVAALIGIVAGYVASVLIGDALGGAVAACLAFIISIKVVLGTTLFGAVGVTIVAMLVSIVGYWALTDLGILGAQA